MKIQILLALLVLTLWSCNVSTSSESSESDKKDTDSAAVVASSVRQPIEFADEKLSTVCKDAMAKLSAGDVDGFVDLYAENAIYRWNNGDSIAGRPAIVKYWQDRRKNVITKLEFTDQVWLPLTVTEADQSGVPKGDWVLAWYTTHATYKTGKSIHQSMHMLFHFNPEGKVDEVIHYLDRGEVKAAAGK